MQRSMALKIALGGKSYFFSLLTLNDQEPCPYGVRRKKGYVCIYLKKSVLLEGEEIIRGLDATQ